MGFLIRAAFWFSLVLLLLPFNAGPDEQAVSPIQALLAAREAVGDIAGMCERKPEVCETGKSAMHTISVRAKQTAKIAADMLDDETVATDAQTVTGSVPVPTPRASIPGNMDADAAEVERSSSDIKRPQVKVERSATKADTEAN